MNSKRWLFTICVVLYVGHHSSAASLCLQYGSYITADCSNCPAGWYVYAAETPWTEWICRRCATGTYKPNVGVGVCGYCDTSSYAISLYNESGLNDGATSCTPCKLDSSSIQGSSTEDMCECNAGFSFHTGSCTSCVAGKYKTHRGNTECDPCSTSACTDGMADVAQMCGLDGKSQCNGKAGLMSSNSAYAKDSHPHFLNDGNPNTYLFAVDGRNSLSAKNAHIEIDLGASRSFDKVVVHAGKYDMTIQNAYIMVLDQAGCNAGPGTFRKVVDSSTNTWQDTTYITDCKTTGRYICIKKCMDCTWEAASIGIGELQVLSLDVVCPAYSHAPAGSRSMGDCVCTAGYEGANGEECTECVSGKYMPSTGTRTCIPCTQTSGCECKAGWYGQLGLDCTECPPRATSLPNSVDATSCFFVSTLATQACVVAE